MPEDIYLVTKSNKADASSDYLRAIGGADYVLEMYKNDIQFDSFGKIVVATGTDKLVQGIIKVVLTELGFNPEDTSYGSNLAGGIGSKIGSISYTDITDGISAALEKYNALNSDNDNSDEFIETIDSIDVYGDENDPRIIYVKISVTTESGKIVSVGVPAQR